MRAMRVFAAVLRSTIKDPFYTDLFYIPWIHGVKLLPRFHASPASQPILITTSIIYTSIAIITLLLLPLLLVLLVLTVFDA